MDFRFSEEQVLLRNLVHDFVRDKYAFEERTKWLNSEAGRNPAIWAEMAELGLLGASLPESAGGSGGGAVETMIIAEELGRGLVIEPYLQSVVVCGGLLARHGDKAQQALVAEIASGQSIFALAHSEPQSRFMLHDCKTKAEKDGKGWQLNGEKAVVLAAPFADWLLVSARVNGKQYDKQGLGLFAVKADTEGVVRKAYRTVDGNRAAEVSFNNVALGADSLLGEAGEGLALLEEAQDHAIAALAAEAIGCMKMLNDATNEYCKTRQQFGVPLSSFQALQHRMVDMFTSYEQSVSMTYLATLQRDAEPSARGKAAAAVKAHIGKAGRHIGQEAIQLHGGMGMTEELRVGHYFKRLTMIDAQFGDVAHHLRRFAAYE